jgi:hypothetical protein
VRRHPLLLGQLETGRIEEGGHDDPVRLEAEIDRGQVAEAGDEHQGRYDEHERKRNLAGDETPLEPCAAAVDRVAA